jgi:hypothetical protein
MQRPLCLAEAQARPGRIAHRRQMARFAVVCTGSAALLLLAMLSALHPRRELLSAGLSSRNDKVLEIAGGTFENPSQVYARQLRTASNGESKIQYSKILRRIKDQQAQAEAQMKQLVQENKAKATALSRALDGDSFHMVSAAKLPRKQPTSKRKLHPRSGLPLAAQSAAVRAAASAGEVGQSKGKRGGDGGGSHSMHDATRVQARISKLVVDAHKRLEDDERRTISDLTSSVAKGPWFHQQQQMRLQDDRRRVLGDKRLVKLLRAMRAQQGLLPSSSAPMQHLDAIDVQARNDLFEAEMRAREQGVADELNPHTHHILAAGVKVGGSRDVGLGGMEGDDEEDAGAEALKRAGVRTDGLPGFGTKVRLEIDVDFVAAVAAVCMRGVVFSL